MNRQSRIDRLVTRKLQSAAGKPLCFASKIFCVCMAGAAATPRMPTPSANPKS